MIGAQFNYSILPAITLLAAITHEYREASVALKNKMFATNISAALTKCQTNQLHSCQSKHI